MEDDMYFRILYNFSEEEIVTAFGIIFYFLKRQIVKGEISVDFCKSNRFLHSHYNSFSTFVYDFHLSIVENSASTFNLYFSRGSFPIFTRERYEK